MVYRIYNGQQDPFTPSTTPTRVLYFELIDKESERSYGKYDTFDACFKAKRGDNTMACQARWTGAKTGT